MNRTRSLRPTWPSLIWSTLLAWLTYLVAGAVLVTIVHAALPNELDAQGRLVGTRVLILDVLAQAIAAFLAGAIALPYARARWQHVAVISGLSLSLVLAVITWTMPPMAPAWFGELTLALTAPFVALGAAWRAAGATESTS